MLSTDINAIQTVNYLFFPCAWSRLINYLQDTLSNRFRDFITVTPQRGPRITGGQSRYQIGDVVRVNCTSYPSKPVCHLSWLINGEPSNRSYLKYYDNIVYGREGLEVAILGLEFRVRGYHFKNGDMKLKVKKESKEIY